MTESSDSNADSATLRRRLAQAINVADILAATAELFPQTVAVAEAPRRRSIGLSAKDSPKARAAYRQIDYRGLDALATKFAGRMQARGVPAGARIALLVPPSIEFVGLFFALLRGGFVTILIDPGMSRRNLIRCLAEARPEGMVGVAKAHLARWVFRKSFPDCRWNFVVRASWPGAVRLDRRVDGMAAETGFARPDTQVESPAAVIFTTGSTGPPKGVLYRHRTFLCQARDIQAYFDLPPGGVDISGFPLFALFNAAMAATTVFPRMDFTRPASINPRNFLSAVDAWSATQSFGSPALWNTMATYCEAHSIRLPTIRNVLTAGAPVPPRTLERVQALIAEGGDVHTPYGATEALPVACITARKVLAETAERTRHGGGTCVGTRFPNIRWRVIRIVDEPIPTIDACQMLPVGEIGELIVSGPVVTDRYVTRPEANALHKIHDGEHVWHRMGDVGYLDSEERFWFCGRKSHRVRTASGTLFTIPCEAIYNQHPAIYRSALVGVGQFPQIPVIVAEPWPTTFPTTRRAAAQLLDELHARGRVYELTQSIEHILLRRRLPVDIRHNSKISREQLAVWAERRLRNQIETESGKQFSS